MDRILKIRRLREHIRVTNIRIWASYAKKLTSPNSNSTKPAKPDMASCLNIVINYSFEMKLLENLLNENYPASRLSCVTAVARSMSKVADSFSRVTNDQG